MKPEINDIVLVEVAFLCKIWSSSERIIFLLVLEKCSIFQRCGGAQRLPFDSNIVLNCIVLV